MARFTIGRLAKESGVTVETVRFYERRGLLTRPSRPGGTGYREYSPRDLAIMQHIKLGKMLGLQLAEMQQLVAFIGEGDRFCEAFRDSLRKKLAFVQEQQEHLRRVEKELTDALSACAARVGQHDCPIQRRLTPPSRET